MASDWIKPFPVHYELYRGINQLYLKPNGEICSAAFTNYELSFDRSDMCKPEDTLKRTYNLIAVASIKHKVPKSLNLIITHAPRINNRAHTLIIGKKTSKIKRTLAKSSEVIINKLK